MQAVILAAGRGKRMGELTNDTPKPMLQVNGRPILEYALLNLPSEITEVIFVIGYKGEIIQNHFGDEFNGLKIRYAPQQELNGTGGAVFAIQNMLDDRFLVLMGDDLYHKSDLERLAACDLAVLVKEIENNTRFGAIETDGEGNLKQIVEFKDLKDRTGHLVNTGAYMLNKEIFNYPLVPVSETEFGLPQTMAQMADTHKIKVIKAEYWHPHSHSEDLEKAEAVIGLFTDHVRK